MIKQLVLISLFLVLGCTDASAKWVEPPSMSQMAARVALEAPRKAVQRQTRVPKYHPSHHTETPSISSTRGYGRRPRKWCGLYMRKVKGVKDPSFNRAIRWASYGSPSVIKIGAVIVWPHHVGYIVGYDKRGWIVRSGNWSNRVADVPLKRMPKNIVAIRS